MSAERVTTPAGPVVPGDLLTRGKVVAGLRQLAGFLETHPDVPVCMYGWSVHVFPVRAATPTAARAEVDRIAGILEVPVHDETVDGHYFAARRFGLITYEAVCVPGQYGPPATQLPARAGVTPVRAADRAEETS